MLLVDILLMPIMSATLPRRYGSQCAGLGTVSGGRLSRAVRTHASKGFSSKSKSSSNAAKEADGLSADFFKWALDGGAKFDKIGEASFKGIRGVKAKTTIAKGQEIVRVPRAIALWVTPKSSCPFSDWIDSTYYKQATWSVKLALKLLYQRREEAQSKVSGYISHLPESVDVPAFWSQEERSALCCPHLRFSIEDQVSAWNKWHADLIASSPQCGVSKADFDWALSLVYSRTFKGPYIGSSIQERLNVLLLIAGCTALALTFGLFPEEQTINAAVSAVLFNFLYELILSRNIQQYALCPVVDLINHDSKVDSEVSYDYFRDGYSVVAGRQFNTGDQVFISYGAQTTDSLMQYYGFVEDGNANDVYTFARFDELLQQVYDVPQGKLAALKAHKDEAVATALAKVTMNNKAQVQEQVKCALRFVLGLAGSVEEAQDKMSNAKDAVMWRAVAEVVELEYANMGRSLQQDEQAVKDAGRTLSDRAAVVFRYNIMKKKYLSARIEQLNTRVSKMQ